MNYKGCYPFDEDNRFIVEIEKFLGDILINNSEKALDSLPNIIDYDTRKDGNNYFLDFLSFYSTISLPSQIDDEFVISIESILQEEINKLIDSIIRYGEEDSQVKQILFDDSVKIYSQLTTKGFYFTFKDTENSITIGIPLDKLQELLDVMPD